MASERHDGTFYAWNVDARETEREAETVTASSPREAAELLVERYDEDSAEFPVASGGDPPLIAVRQEGSAAVEYYRVSGQFVAVYDGVLVDRGRDA